MASSNWCCDDVRPTDLAWSSLHRRNRRSPSRNDRSRAKSASSSGGGTAPLPVSTGPDISYHDTLDADMVVQPSSRRLLLLTAIAAVLGLAGGVAAWVLVHLISAITSVVLFHQWTIEHPPLGELDINPVALIGAATAGAFLISL